MDALERSRMLLADAVGMELADVPLDAQIGQFDRWDSLAHVRLILSIEEYIGRLLDPDETIRIENLSDVSKLLHAPISVG